MRELATEADTEMRMRSGLAVPELIFGRITSKFQHLHLQSSLVCFRLFLSSTRCGGKRHGQGASVGHVAVASLRKEPVCFTLGPVFGALAILVPFHGRPPLTRSGSSASAGRCVTVA